MSASPPPPAGAPIAELIRSVRRAPTGNGQQYEVQWKGQVQTTWEAASRARRSMPLLVQTFEQQQQPPPPSQKENTQAAEGEATAADGSSMRAQLQAMQQLVQDQAAQLQQLRASPIPPPSHSPQQTSRFARKEPRAFF